MASSDSLRSTLDDLVGSGTESNAALNLLISDYARFHLALVVVGGAFLMCLVLVSVVFWRRFRRAPKAATGRWTFERRTYFAFGVVSVLVALFLALIVAANISNVVNPRHGFAGSIPLLGTPHTGSAAAALQDSFGTWVEAGTTDVPSAVRTAIDDRLAWQRPKAIICAVLLAGFVVLCAVIWRSLIRRSRRRSGRRSLGDWVLLLVGVATVGTCLVLMLMVMGNTQASLAPISMTLFYG